MSREAVIITTTPNAVTKSIHDRMPAIIEQKDFDRWPDPATPPDELAAMLKPLPDDQLEAYPVSRLVNAPAEDRQACIARSTEDVERKNAGLFR